MDDNARIVRSVVLNHVIDSSSAAVGRSILSNSLIEFLHGTFTL